MSSKLWVRSMHTSLNLYAEHEFNASTFAARVIAAFSARLRDQVDLDALHGELLAVVDQTMQPTQAWLWQRPPPGAGRARSLSR